MGNLEQNLGKALRTKDVAQYLGVDEKTIRKYYQELGGIRLGRRFVFFEKEIENAVQKRTEMESPGEEKRIEKGEDVQYEEGCCGVGSRNTEKARQRVDRNNRHGLLD